MNPQRNAVRIHFRVFGIRRQHQRVSAATIQKRPRTAPPQVARGTELGRRAQEYVERRDFVPDDLVLELVRERLAEVRGSAEG